MPDPTPLIVDPHGKPARPAIDTSCPQCGQGPEVRGPSGGFGTPWPVCPCGYEWKDQVWR